MSVKKLSRTTLRVSSTTWVCTWKMVDNLDEIIETSDLSIFCICCKMFEDELFRIARTKSLHYCISPQWCPLAKLHTQNVSRRGTSSYSWAFTGCCQHVPRPKRNVKGGDKDYDSNYGEQCLLTDAAYFSRITPQKFSRVMQVAIRSTWTIFDVQARKIQEDTRRAHDNG